MGVRPSSDTAATGYQYRRSSAPMGVPGPTRVSRSFTAGDNMSASPLSGLVVVGARSVLRAGEEPGHLVLDVVRRRYQLCGHGS